MDSPDRVEHMIAEAMQHIGLRNPKAALRIGKELEGLRLTSAFEIQALAYAAMDKRKNAIKILDKAIKIAPENAFLWQLLGNNYSDEGLFEKSKECYEHALTIKDSDRMALLYNYALMLERCDKYDLAEMKIAEIFQSNEFLNADKELAMLSFSLRIGIFNRLEKYDDAEDAFHSCLKHPSFNINRSPGFSRVLFAFANTLLKTQKLQEAEAEFVKAIQQDRFNTDAQGLLREMRSQNDFSKARYMRIMVQGQWDESEGFFSTYDVVADSEEEALSFINEIEPEEIRCSLKIEEVKILRSPKQPKGIYNATSYFTYK